MHRPHDGCPPRLPAALSSCEERRASGRHAVFGGAASGCGAADRIAPAARGKRPHTRQAAARDKDAGGADAVRDRAPGLGPPSPPASCSAGGRRTAPGAAPRMAGSGAYRGRPPAAGAAWPRSGQGAGGPRGHSWLPSYFDLIAANRPANAAAVPSIASALPGASRFTLSSSITVNMRWATSALSRDMSCRLSHPA